MLGLVWAGKTKFETLILEDGRRHRERSRDMSRIQTGSIVARMSDAISGPRFLSEPYGAQPVFARSASDEAIHSFFLLRDGLLRFARNDGEKVMDCLRPSQRRAGRGDLVKIRVRKEYFGSAILCLQTWQTETT
jgi:hypothetical protein